MGAVLGLNGAPVDGALPEKTPLSVLRDLVKQIEDGQLTLETILVVGSRASDRDKSMVVHPMWDNGLTLAETVFMLEVAKADLLLVSRN